MNYGRDKNCLLERIERQRTYYINGEMWVRKESKVIPDINLYRPADLDGKVLHLHYARAEELDRYLYMVAGQGKIYVQRA